MNPLCQIDSLIVSQLNVSQKGQWQGFWDSPAIKRAGILTGGQFTGHESRQQMLGDLK
jgi:hypothetical protein